MDFKTGQVAPSVKNASCSHPRYLVPGHSFIVYIGVGEVIEASIILILTLGVIGANILVIFVINSRRYSSYIHLQVSFNNYAENL